MKQLSISVRVAAVALLAMLIGMPDAPAQEKLTVNAGEEVLVAKLRGDDEFPSVISTKAKGEFTAKVSSDGTSIEYELSYTGIEGGNVTGAHIHFGHPFSTGGVAAFLCGGGNKPACPSPSGRVTGTIVAGDIVGPANQGIAAGELAELLRAIRRDRAYVNVHSTQFPGGEIRGHIARVQPTIVTGTGNIEGAVATFRTLLGDPLNGVLVGQQPAGRREINWDAVPAAFTNVDNFPADFFNTRSPRGAVFSTPGTGFRVSDTNFADVNASYGAQFNFFSPNKTFAAVGSNIMDVRFEVAGSVATPAVVRGFGVVFSDVDTAGSTKIEFFSHGMSLGVYNAPVRSDAGGLSFVGVVFHPSTVEVTRVRITSGQGALGANVNDVTSGGTLDLVIMDDFFYSEPRPDVH